MECKESIDESAPTTPVPAAAAAASAALVTTSDVKRVLGGDWKLAIDGPAQSYPCGDMAACRTRQVGVTEICCCVAARRYGRGFQIRVHYKGYTARFNEWQRAEDVRKVKPLEVEALIRKKKAEAVVPKTARKRKAALTCCSRASHGCCYG
jgi:hypothetical protein